LPTRRARLSPLSSSATHRTHIIAYAGGYREIFETLSFVQLLLHLSPLCRSNCARGSQFISSKPTSGYDLFATEVTYTSPIPTLLHQADLRMRFRSSQASHAFLILYSPYSQVPAATAPSCAGLPAGTTQAR
jgi:hypothetical protein